MAIVNDSIKNQLYDEIRHNILRKKYKMGEQLNAKVLAAQYGVSAMPVRDALLQLTKQGLVVNRERVGFYVVNYGSADIENMMEVRKMHELFCMEKYFDHMDRQAFEENYNAMVDALGKDKKAFDQRDVDFHNMIVLTSKNEFLNNQYDRIKDLLTLLVYYDDEHDEEACEEHGSMIRAMAEGNKDKAVHALDYHLNRVAEQIAYHLSLQEKEDLKESV